MEAFCFSKNLKKNCICIYNALHFHHLIPKHYLKICFNLHYIEIWKICTLLNCTYHITNIFNFTCLNSLSLVVTSSKLDDSATNNKTEKTYHLFTITFIVSDWMIFENPQHLVKKSFFSISKFYFLSVILLVLLFLFCVDKRLYIPYNIVSQNSCKSSIDDNNSMRIQCCLRVLVFDVNIKYEQT